MDLDELNAKVTAAILYAESLPLGSMDAQSAFREVSNLEETIAALASANDVEGEIARLGAVSGALSAGEALRALQLARRYGSDALSFAARTKLDELRKEAEIEIERAALNEPIVEPVRFHLRAA
jgi:hypothetical protein